MYLSNVLVIICRLSQVFCRGFDIISERLQQTQWFLNRTLSITSRTHDNYIKIEVCVKHKQRKIENSYFYPEAFSSAK